MEATPEDVLPVRRYCFRAEKFIEFFAAVRKQDEPVNWTFLLVTRNDRVWTEAMLNRGMPVSWISVRLFNRRFTRCTLGYSKKLENLKHAAALFVWHFDFCGKHGAHGFTPAFAAGVAPKDPMTIEQLLARTN